MGSWVSHVLVVPAGLSASLLRATHGRCSIRMGTMNGEMYMYIGDNDYMYTFNSPSGCLDTLMWCTTVRPHLSCLIGTSIKFNMRFGRISDFHFTAFLWSSVRFAHVILYAYHMSMGGGGVRVIPMCYIIGPCFQLLKKTFCYFHRLPECHICYSKKYFLYYFLKKNWNLEDYLDPADISNGLAVSESHSWSGVRHPRQRPL